MTKRIIAVVLAAVILFSLTGCIRVTSGVKFNSDGTVEVSYLYAVAEQTGESGDIDVSQLFMDEKTVAAYEEAGFTCTKYNEDGYTGYIISMSYDPNEPVEEDTPAPTPAEEGSEDEYAEDVPELEGMIAVRTAWLVEDGIAYFDYKANDTEQLEEAQQSAEIINALGGFVKFTLEMPIKPISSNATEVSEDGKALTWDAFATEKFHAEYDFEELQKNGVVLATYATNPFEDVKYGTFYHDPVLWAYDWGITTGTTETTFSPDATCTRGQVVTFLWRAFGEPEPETTENPFTDVKESDYFCKAVLWAVENGITAGTSETTFSPNTTCSYAHILTFIWRTFDEPEKTGEGEWYTDAVNWASANGMLDGILTGELDPSADCPRGVVVTFLYRTVEAYSLYYVFFSDDYDYYDDEEGNEPEDESEEIESEEIAE